VLALLGEPDDIQTENDPGGIATLRTREIWCCGTNGHLTFPTLGSIYIDKDGKALYIYGDQGEPPDPKVFPEEELRSLLPLLDQIPSYNAGFHFDPLAVIRAANALQPLGKERALTAIAEYLRVALHFQETGREGAFLVLRVLFDVPLVPGHMPHMCVGAPSPAAPKEPKRLPHFPLLLLDDVPLLLVAGYELEGVPQSARRHLEYFRTKGRLRDKPLTPANNPLRLLDRFVETAGWLYPSEGWLSGKALICNQLLRLIDSVYRRERDARGLLFPLHGNLDEQWKALVAEVTKLDIHWSAEKARYTFKDGSYLPDRARKQYRRNIWKLEGLAGDAELVLERTNERHVTVLLHWSGSLHDMVPVTVVRVFGARDPATVLVEMSLGTIGIFAGDQAFSTESRVIELAEGDEVQVKLKIGEDEKLSPKFKP
jgi:hypothetical protein